MKYARYMTLVALLYAVSFLDSKIMVKRPTTTIGYENIFSTFKNTKPSQEDLPVLKRIKNEIDNQIKALEISSLERSPEIKKDKPDLDSVALKAGRLTVTYGHSTDKGKSKFNHVEINGGRFFGVYDGHGNGGSKVSAFLKENLHDYFKQCLASEKNIKQAFECAFAQAEKFALEHFDDGSSAVVTFIDKDNRLYCAWVGDSRAVLEQDGKVQFVTQDHKPDRENEKERIEQAGGKVTHMQGVSFVNRLAFSRSIGDKNKKTGQGEIIAVPEYAEMQLNEKNHFMIVASNGLWDKISNEDAVAMVAQGLEDKKPLNDIVRELQNTALDKGNKDSITVCVVTFDW